MKTFRSLRKKSVSRPTAIPLTNHLFQSRLFRDTLPSKTVQSKSQVQADIQTKIDRLRRTNPDYAQLGIQRKLTVGAPNDQYEQEADRVADQVMNTSDAAIQQSVQREAMPEEEEVQTKPLAASITPLVQREAMPEEEEVQMKAIDSTLQREAMPEEEEVQTKPLGDTLQREEMPEEEEVQTKSFGDIQREEMPEEEDVQTKPLGNIQREAMPEEEEVQTKPLNRIQREAMPEEEEVQTKPALQRAANGSFQAGRSIESQLNNSKGGGSPLPEDVRSFMEPRFGVDLNQVRAHTDSEAVQMSRDLNAQAFTHKKDVYFGAGKAPGKDALTAHELTHVVQQMDKSQVSIVRTQHETLEKDLRNIKVSSSIVNKKYEHPLIQRQVIGQTGLRSFRFKGQGGETLQDCFDGRQKLQKGSTGRAVGIIQQALLDLGYRLRIMGADGRVDEKYGNDTKEKVGQFQQNNGLARDGVVGENTIRALDDFFSQEHQEESDLSTAFFLSPPPAEYQPTPTTCWSASLLSWMKAIGEQPKPEPLGRIQVPQDYANFYGFEDDGATRKKDENGNLFLNDDLSLKDSQFFKVIRREKPEANPVTEANKTSPGVIRKQLEKSYIYMAFGVRNGTHDVVVYGVDSEKVYYMDPATATYKHEPIPIVENNVTLMVKE